MSEERSLISGDQYLSGLLMFFYRAVRKQLLLAVLLPLIVMTITYVATQQLTPIYAAQANIRIGRIDGTEPISAKTAVARIISPSFKARIVKSMAVAKDSRDAQLIFDTLSARPDEPGDSVIVSARGLSGEQLRQAIEAVVRAWNEEQEKTQEPLVAEIRAQLANVDANIANLSATRESLSTLAKAFNANAAADTQVESSLLAIRRVWLADLASRNDQSLSAARSERNALATRLSSWKTYPATILDEVFVSQTPVFPRPAATAILAGCAAVLGFILYVLLSGPKAAAAK